MKKKKRKKKSPLEELGCMEGTRRYIAVAQRAGGYVDYRVQQQRLHRRRWQNDNSSCEELLCAIDRLKHDEYARCVALKSNRAHC